MPEFIHAIEADNHPCNIWLNVDHIVSAEMVDGEIIVVTSEFSTRYHVEGYTYCFDMALDKLFESWMKGAKDNGTGQEAQNRR